MDAQKELIETKERQRQAVEQLNNLRQQFQQQEQALLQEILRTDGEIRLLQRLSKDGDKGNNGQPRPD